MTKTIASLILLSTAFIFGVGTPAEAQQSPLLTPGNIVVTVEGCGVHGGTCAAVMNGAGSGAGTSSVGGYGDNQAAPLTLFQYTPAGTASVAYMGAVVLPQSPSGANVQVSGEYGSSSEAMLQLSGTGQYLTVMGYGVDALSFNANPENYGTLINPKGAANYAALGQTGSLTLNNQTPFPTAYPNGYTPVARVLALIDANGNVNTSSAFYNIFDFNNPRSAFTENGSTAYLSGQGSGTDGTGGVFYSLLGAVNSAPTAITGDDACASSGCATPTIAQDTRTVQIYNGTLYVSVDSTEGKSNNRSFIGTLGNPPATGMYTPTAPPTGDLNGPMDLSGFGNTGGTGKVTIATGANTNGNPLNNSTSKVNSVALDLINLSPENYFFASASVLYVADSGDPKNDSEGDNNCNGTANIGDGGLQKWVNSKTDGTGSWSLKYTLYQGLNLVNNCGASGTSGLLGLTGVVSGNNVLLYATNFTLNDLDPTYLYGITDTLSNVTPPGPSLAFTLLDTAPTDSNFKGVSFAPVTPAGDVEITSSPSGLAFTSAGSGCAAGAYTTPQMLSWTPGSSCTLSVAAPQSALGVSYGFVQWEDGTTSTTHVVTAPQSTSTSLYTYSATFAAQTAPAITWSTPAAVTFGSALSGIQLDASANVAGTFSYSPAAGTVLPVGNNEALSATFTPADTIHYTSANGSTTITVNPAPPPATPVNLVVTKTLTRVSGNIIVTLTFANTGGTAATNVTLNTFNIAATPGAPLPLSIGTVAAGASVTATVTVLGSAGAPGASSFNLSGSYTGGSFNSSGRVTLP